MRMRTIHEGFWNDKRLARMPDAARLTYVGIWMLSDDAGWSNWDPEEMAIQLFPWLDARSRDRKFAAAAKALVEAGRIRIADCGAHAEVPKLHIYQRAGHPTYSIREGHHRQCRSITRQSALNPDPIESDRASSVEYSSVEEGKSKKNTTGSMRETTGAREEIDGDGFVKAALERHGYRPPATSPKRLRSGAT